MFAVQFSWSTLQPEGVFRSDNYFSKLAVTGYLSRWTPEFRKSVFSYHSSGFQTKSRLELHQLWECNPHVNFRKSQHHFAYSNTKLTELGQ